MARDFEDHCWKDVYDKDQMEISKGYSRDTFVGDKQLEVGGSKAPQTITFANPGAQSYGTTPTLTATADSGLTPTFTSATTGVCTVTGGALTFIKTGNCTINADQSGDGNYNAATQVAQSFTVDPKALTIASPAVTSEGTNTGRHGYWSVSQRRCPEP